MAQAVITQVDLIRCQAKTPYTVLAHSAGVGESTLRRWRMRAVRRATVLQTPGPKKVKRLDVVALRESIECLNHGRHRSAGAPSLWREYADQISRRDYYGLLTRYRVRLHQAEYQEFWRYKWLKVGAVWAMDDMAFGWDENGEPLKTHNVMELGSRKLFEPLVEESVLAEKVADNMKNLCKKHGVPVCVKSDGGSNLLASKPVSDVMSELNIIPLISPPYYPQYNGAIERAQSDVRSAMEDLLPVDAACPKQHFRAYAIAGTYRCNDISRSVLDGQCAAYVFNTRNGEMKTNLKERGEICDWINNKQESILLSTDAKPDDKQARNAAWRSAVEEWMLQNEIIEIIPGSEKVSTNLWDFERS